MKLFNFCKSNLGIIVYTIRRPSLSFKYFKAMKLLEIVVWFLAIVIYYGKEENYK